MRFKTKNLDYANLSESLFHGEHNIEQVDHVNGANVWNLSLD